MGRCRLLFWDFFTFTWKMKTKTVSNRRNIDTKKGEDSVDGGHVARPWLKSVAFVLTLGRNRDFFSVPQVF
jgi:hypothetical protein